MFLLKFILFGVYKYAKGCINIAIGRRTGLSPRDLFFRVYILHALGIRPLREITCMGLRGEGAGSQALMMMSAIAFARVIGLRYLHTPFSDIAHADRPMPDWVATWEDFFNLGMGEELPDQGMNGKICSYAHNYYNILPLFGISPPGWPDISTLVVSMVSAFQEKYHANKVFLTNDNFTVCVHIRRGDIKQGDSRWTGNDVVSATINKVRNVLNRRNVEYKVCIFSQGELGDFSELVAPNTEFYLDADASWTIQQLIGAKIFIMGKGCFSYVAALLSNQIVLYSPPQFTPLPHWVVVDSKGDFDGAELERQLMKG